MDRLHVTRGIQQHAAFGRGGGDLAKTQPHARVKSRIEAFVPVTVAATPAHAVGGDILRHIQNQRQIRINRQQPDLFGDKAPVGTLTITLVRQR